MRNLALTPTPKSSVKSSPAVDESDRSVRQDKGYFPGCRKCGNCNCEMCLASMTATLDLMPMSVQRSSLTKLCASNQIPPSPVSFDSSSPLSTPNSITTLSPPLNSKSKLKFPNKNKDTGHSVFFVVVKLVLALSFVFAAEFGFSWVIPRVFHPKLSPDIVRNLGEKSWAIQDFNERIMYLRKEVNLLVGAKVSNASSHDLVWEIIQDGLLMGSRCTLYKSWFEELSVFGCQFHTSGLLTAEFSSQSYTILSGKLTQWSNGEMGYSVQRANSSWTQGKWRASIVHLDRNTWILKYTRSSVVESRRLLTSTLKFLKLRITRKVQNMKRKFWVFFEFGNQYSGFKEDSLTIIPT